MRDASREILKRWLWGLGFLAIFITLAWQLERLATLFLLSFIFAYVLDPLVTRLARLRFISRAFATVITLVGLVVAVSAVFFVVVPDVAEEFRAFLGRLPALTDKFQNDIVPWIEKNFDRKVPVSWSDALDQAMVQVQKGGRGMIAPAAQIAGNVFGTTFYAVLNLLSMLMFPLFLFFLLKDFPKILESVDRLIPVRNRETVHHLARDVDKSLSAFLHGQFTVMLILGTLYSVGYSIVGVPVAVGVGLLTGLLCFIPYVGAASGFLLALTLAALEMNGWHTVVGVCIVFGVVQILDATLITPKILGGKLGLRPLWIIVALMAGGELFGFLGMLLAVPTAAVLKILVLYTVDRYKRSSLFLDGVAPDDPTDGSAVPPDASGGDHEGAGPVT